MYIKKAPRNHIYITKHCINDCVGVTQMVVLAGSKAKYTKNKAQQSTKHVYPACFKHAQLCMMTFLVFKNQTTKVYLYQIV